MSSDDSTVSQGFTRGQVAVLVFVTMAATMIFTVWLVRVYVFPAEFTPVELDTTEQQVLDAKLVRMETLGQEPGRLAGEPGTVEGDSDDGDDDDDQAWLDSGAYEESDARRQVRFSERELNALVAGNTDLARRVAIDLSDDLATARLLLPLDEDFPFFGGKTLRVKAGVELAYRSGRPVVMLRGVSVMGVPIPNAWLGNLKNVDLIGEYGADQGFWKPSPTEWRRLRWNRERWRFGCGRNHCR